MFYPYPAGLQRSGNADPEKQTVEVLERFDLRSCIKPFTRGIECNGMIEPLAVASERFEQEKHRIPPGELLRCGDFSVCSVCRRIYWKGTHYDKLQQKINRIMKSAIR